MVNLLPLCDYWGWDEFAPGQPGSSPQFLSVEQASDRLDFGPCPLAQKQSSWTQEGIRWKIPCFDQPSSHTGQTTVMEMVEQIGTETVVVSPDSHPEGERLNSHLP